MAAKKQRQRAPRHHRPPAEKRRMVELTLRAGASLRAIAREHGVHPNSLRRWKTLYRAGVLEVQSTPRVEAPPAKATFVPVSLVQQPCPCVLIAGACGAERSVVQLTLSSGATLRIETGALDAALVCALVADCSDERRGERHDGRHARLAGCRHYRHAQRLYRLSALVQNALASNPFCGHVFVFRGRRGDLLKLLWWDGTGLCLMAKRLERGRFIWPQAQNGRVSLSAAQLSMLLEGIDWRHPVRTADPRIEM